MGDGRRIESGSPENWACRRCALEVKSLFHSFIHSSLLNTGYIESTGSQLGGKGTEQARYGLDTRNSECQGCFSKFKEPKCLHAVLRQERVWSLSVFGATKDSQAPPQEASKLPLCSHSHWRRRFRRGKGRGRICQN